MTKGGKISRECPHLNPVKVVKLSPVSCLSKVEKVEQPLFLRRLEEKIGLVDFEVVAPLIGAIYKNKSLVINSLGKDFIVDKRGNVTSECHIIPWVRAPLLSYITNETHGDVTGKWISFREIKGGIDWQPLFTSRCETPLKTLADDNPDLLRDLIDLFMGEAVDWYQSDIALILYPLKCPF